VAPQYKKITIVEQSRRKMAFNDDHLTGQEEEEQQQQHSQQQGHIPENLSVDYMMGMAEDSGTDEASSCNSLAEESDTDDMLSEEETGSSSPSSFGSPVAADANHKVVLVTGGAGFVGSHVADVLLGRGDSVIIVDEINDYYDVSLKRANLDLLVEKYGTERLKIVEVRREGRCKTSLVMVMDPS